MIQQGEGYSLEFKQSIPSKLSELARELCAFANASGGTILVGVNDYRGITASIGLGKTSVDKHIDQLKALGLISREGSRKTGKWIISLIPYKEY